MKAQGRKDQASGARSDKNPMLFQLKSTKKETRGKINIKLDFSEYVQIKNDDGAIEKGITVFSKASQEMEQNVVYQDGSKVVGSDVSFSQENEEMFQRFAGKPTHKNAKQCLIKQAVPRTNQCQICKQFFNDYLQHIKHPNHIKQETANTKKNARVFNDLLDQINYQTKRTRSQNILPNHDFEDEEFMKNGSMSKIRLISDQSTLRIEKKKTEETYITSTTSISGKCPPAPLVSLPSILLLP